MRCIMRRASLQYKQLGRAGFRSCRSKSNPTTLAAAPGLGQIPCMWDSVLATQSIAVRSISRERGPRTRRVAHETGGSFDCPRAENSEEKLSIDQLHPCSRRLGVCCRLCFSHDQT